ncbi:MAG: SDR family NAD(P)-dependent oxidoreductase [Planctomycetaceae bacterium]
MADDLFDVSDRVVLITGGSRGIGRAIAGGFARRGAKVVICSRQESSVASTVAEFQSEGLSMTGLVCDVSSTDSIQQTVDSALKQFDRIDTLINVAGVACRDKFSFVKFSLNNP